MNEFSALKAAWHIDRIADLRAGKDIVPTHVQIILSDLCNQNCLPAGTMIECPNGIVPIESLTVGDMVIGPDGRAVPVSAVGNRLADEIFEIRVGERVIQATDEHPFLTADGWKEAKRLRPGRDRAVVRVRVRSESEVESAPTTVGALRVRAPQSGVEKLLGMEGVDAPTVSGRSAAAVSLWVRPAGEAALARSGALLGELLEGAPVAGEDRNPYAGRDRAPGGAYAAAQPDVRSEGRGAGSANARDHRIADEGGVAVLEMDEGKRPTDQFSRNREALDQSTQPGLPGVRAEEGNRDFNHWNLQRWFGRAEDGGNIRGESRAALHGERLGVPGDLLPAGPSAPSASQPTAGRDRLLLEGIELERGLELRPIDSIRRIAGRVRVYNFSCPPIEAYEANGFAVHNCHFCAYRMDGGFSTENFADEKGNKNPNRRIPTAKALEILDDCAAMGVEAIEFTGGGEPTVHPQCFEIIAYAQKLGMATGLVTNGVKLKPHPAIEALTWLRISLDAGTPESYERIRESKAWPQVMKALAYAGTLKGPYVGVGFVVTRENYKELAQACQIVKDAGIPYVRVSAMFSAGGELYYSGVEDQIDACRAEAKKLQDGTFKVVDFFSSRIEDLRQHAPDYKFCGEQQFVLYVGGDCKVYRCCTTAYTNHGEIGDLKEQRFADWLKTYRRYDFDARSCHTCQFNKTNRNLNYLLDPAPAHVGFV